MGLDIISVSSVEFIPEWDDDGDSDGMRLYVNPAFAERADGLRDGGYSYDAGSRMSFRAGSYWGYSQFRAWLCRTALGVNPEEIWANPPSKPAPFYELINFSDCEGTIGAKTSEKLAADFESFKTKIDSTEDPALDDVTIDYFKSIYAKFHEAFVNASKNGAVKFS